MSSRERKTITRSVSSYNIKPINIRILSYNNQLKTHTKDQNFPIEEHYWKPNSLSAKTRLMFIMKILWNQTASLGGGFRQEVGMFVLRIYMRDVKLSILDMLSQNVGTHIDVFRAGVRHGVKSHLDRTLIILQICMNGFSNQA